MKEKALKYIRKFSSEHIERYSNEINDKDAETWLPGMIPLFECDDPIVEETYYFRFWTFRKHLRRTEDGWVISEFLPKVGWSDKNNMIVCPVGHHINEGRWLRDKNIIKDDIRYALAPKHRENTMNYTNTLIPCACAYCVDYNDTEFAQEIFPLLENHYADLIKTHETKYGLYWSNDDRDGMELSISGHGLRPTVNSYMYGAAMGLAAVAGMVGSPKKAEYEAEAAKLRELIHRHLWDEKDGFFKNVPMDSPDAEADLKRANPDKNVMEEIGFIPWCYDGLTDPENDKAYRYLSDETRFDAPYGITSADMKHPRFMSCEARHECIWDGPVWPYATSQTLTGIYTLLRSRGSAEVDAGAYMKHLHKYAEAQHIYINGKVINWIDEDQDPFTGQWIARDLIYLDHWYKGGYPTDRGAEYNHSTFCDLVLSGACGIWVHDGCLTVKPLAAASWKYFAVENMRIGDSDVSIYYDPSLTRYGFGRAITVVVNGRAVGEGDGEVTVRIR